MRVILVREFLVKLGFDADEGAVRSFDGAVRNLTVGLTAVVGAATAASVAAFNLAQGAASYGDEVAKTARTIGIGGQALQEYRFALDRLGVSEGEATAGLDRFNRALGRAAAGGATEAGAFETLGINIRDASGNLRAMEDLLPEAADALAGITNEAERAAVAQDLFGRSGGRLAMALAAGGDEIERLREEFRLLGGGLSDEQLTAAEEFTDAMTNLRTVLNGLRLQIGAELMPVFQPLIEALTQFMVMNRALITQAAQRFFAELAGVMQRLVRVGEEVIGWITRLADAFTRLTGIEQIALAVGLLLFSWQRLGKWFVAAGLLAILDDISAWMAGQPSLIAKLLGPYEEFAQSVASLVESLGGLENVIRIIVGLALLAWVAKVAGAIRGLAVAFGLAGAGAAASAAGAAAGAGWGAAFLASVASRIGPLAALLGLPVLGGAAIAYTLKTFDEATSTPEQRAARPDEQAERAAAMFGMDTLGNPLSEPRQFRFPEPQAPQSFDPSGLEFSFQETQPLGQFPFDFGGTPSQSPDPSGLEVVPLQPIQDGLDEVRQYLDSLQGASIDVNDGSLMGDVDQSQTANISLTLQQSITVPPGTTSEQLAVIRRESEAAIERAADRAAASLEM